VLIPDIGVMGVAVGGDAARAGKPPGLQLLECRFEEIAQGIAIGDAVDFDPEAAEVLPFQGFPWKGEDPVAIKLGEPSAEFPGPRGIDQPLVEQPVDRIGGALRGTDWMQCPEIDPDQLLVQAPLGGKDRFHRPHVLRKIQFPDDISKASVMAAPIDQNLLAGLGRGMQRLVDR